MRVSVKVYGLDGRDFINLVVLAAVDAPSNQPSRNTRFDGLSALNAGTKLNAIKLCQTQDLLCIYSGCRLYIGCVFEKI